MLGQSSDIFSNLLGSSADCGTNSEGIAVGSEAARHGAQGEHNTVQRESHISHSFHTLLTGVICLMFWKNTTIEEWTKLRSKRHQLAASPFLFGGSPSSMEMDASSSRTVTECTETNRHCFACNTSPVKYNVTCNLHWNDKKTVRRWTLAMVRNVWGSYLLWIILSKNHESNEPKIRKLHPIQLFGVAIWRLISRGDLGHPWTPFSILYVARVAP